MDNFELNSKWENMSSFESKNGYKALRVNSTCLPDLFIGVDYEGFQSLILYLPKGLEVKTKGKNKNKLELLFIPVKSVLLIKLKDLSYLDLFNDLILSIFSKINSIQDSEYASKEFIATFHKWSDFFEDILGNNLGENQIEGLFGELFILNEFIEQSDSYNINSILKSWKGLYDTSNDFEFDLKNIEVKTKKISQPFVSISSEFQLEIEHNKGLELHVVSVLIDLTEGKSIHDLTKIIFDGVRIQGGDLEIIYDAFFQKGLTVDSIRQYDNYRFVVKKVMIYDCTLSDFPKLSTSNIPEEISRLKYNLSINTLNDFLIQEKTY